MVNAAVHLGHKVIIPFRPDYISEYALDRMADKVEDWEEEPAQGRSSMPFDMWTDNMCLW